MDIHAILDQLDEIIYLSDPKSYELLYLNRRGRTIFGAIKEGAKCYEHLQGADKPCEFCTNEILHHSPDHRHIWVRRHPAVGTMLLHDSLVEYAGRLCRMEEAIDINRYMDELQDARLSLAAERELAGQLHKQSRTDWLTGFWNRFAYDEILDALQEEQRRNQSVGVGFADLNRLKWINDNLGTIMAIRLSCTRAS